MSTYVCEEGVALEQKYDNSFKDNNELSFTRNRDRSFINRGIDMSVDVIDNLISKKNKDIEFHLKLVESSRAQVDNLHDIRKKLLNSKVSKD